MVATGPNFKRQRQVDLGLRIAWTACQVPGRSGLHCRTLSQTNKILDHRVPYMKPGLINHGLLALILSWTCHVPAGRKYPIVLFNGKPETPRCEHPFGDNGDTADTPEVFICGWTLGTFSFFMKGCFLLVSRLLHVHFHVLLRSK